MRTVFTCLYSSQARLPSRFQAFWPDLSDKRIKPLRSLVYDLQSLDQPLSRLRFSQGDSLVSIRVSTGHRGGLKDRPVAVR